MSKANYLIIHLTTWAGLSIGAKHYYCEITALKEGKYDCDTQTTNEKTEWISFDRMIDYLNLALLDRYPKHLPKHIEFSGNGLITKHDFLKQYYKCRQMSKEV